MAKTFAQITLEIEALQLQAKAARQKEIAGVVERMKEAIAVYGLTADDFGLNRVSTASSGNSRAAKIQKSATALDPSAKYRDQDGNEWVGRGPRPRWLRSALAAGHSLESFAVNATESVATPASKATKTVVPGKRKSRVKRAKYKDDAGHTWSGRGPRPGWFKDAIAAGKSPEQLAT